MIAVVAAGGKGTRMLPATMWVNKHLLPCGDKTLMIDYPLTTVRKLRFESVTVVTGCEHAGQISEYVQDGEKYEFQRVNYEIQPKPAGIGDVVCRVRHLVDHEGMFLILGDNYFSEPPNLFEMVDWTHGNHAVAWEFDVQSNEKAKAFGQVLRDRFDAPMKIVEKPELPDHSRIVVGAYYFPRDVVDKVGHLAPSKRNELEITTLLWMYLKERRLTVSRLEAEWRDLGEYQTWMEHVALGVKG